MKGGLDQGSTHAVGKTRRSQAAKGGYLLVVGSLIPWRAATVDGASESGKANRIGEDEIMAETLFFNLHDPDQGIRRQLSEGLETRVFPGEHAMLSVVRVAPNGEGTLHSHPEEQWGVLLEGSGVRLQDGVEHPVEAGDFWRTPGGIAHSFRAGPEGAVVLDVFSPPREEYRKAGAGFGV
jgi:quercetin dioxygenase-like cupin family protein